MWNTIIGHDRQKDRLIRAIRSLNLPHAYLFSGIEGIGKRLTARIAAITILCSNAGEKLAACGTCANCLKALSQSHPDLIEIAPENNQITIDIIRDIKSQMKFAPLEGSRRIIIINQAETMNTNAANAALKILEEPPAGNHFFLLTQAPSQLLPTILSRCQKMEFSPLTNEEIERLLCSQRDYSKEQARIAASIGCGSVSIALGINPEIINSVTEELKQLLLKPSSVGIMELSNKWAAEKEDAEKILYILHRCFHLALIAHFKTQNHPAINTEIAGLSALINSKNGPDKLIQKCGEINSSHAFMTRTYNKQLMFEQLLFTLAA